MARSLGATIGLTIGSAIYQNILKKSLWARFGGWPDAGGEIERIRNDLDEINHLPEGWRGGVVGAYVQAFRGVWGLMLGLAVVGLVCMGLLREFVLHRRIGRE